MSADLLERGLSNLAVAAALAVPAIVAGWWGKRPALTHALWLLVLLKLVTPPVVGLPVRVLPPKPVVAEAPTAPVPTPVPPPVVVPATPPASPDPVEVAMVTPPKTLRKVNELKFPPAEWLNALSDPQAATMPPGKAAPPAQTAARPAAITPARVAEPPPPSPPSPGADVPRSPEPAPFPWAAVALGVWVGGGLLWLALVAVRVRQFARVLRLADPAPDWLAREVAAAAADLGLGGPPRVKLVPGAVAPMVWSLGRTTVYLPAELLGRLSADGRAALVTHELAHLRRGDHMARWLELLALALYWWCPLAWLARRELRRSEEECADAWVVAARPAAGRTYASALLDTLDFLAGARPAPALATGMGTAAALRRRLLLILAGTTPKRLPALGRLAVVAAALLVLPLGPRLARLTAAPDEVKTVEVKSTNPAPVAGRAAPAGTTPRGEPLLYEPSPADVRPRGLTMWGLAVSPDGALAVSTHGDRETTGEVVLWDRASGAVKAAAPFPAGVRAAAYSPDGNVLATAGYDGVIRLHDPLTLAVWAGADEAAGGHKASSGANGVCFFKAGKYLATAGLDNLVHVWQVPTKKPDEVVTFSPVATLKGHTGGVLSVSASEDGKTLLSGSFDNTARAWDLPDALPKAGDKPLLVEKPRLVISDHGNAVEAVAVSPDGKYLATGSWDARFRVRGRDGQAAVELDHGFQSGVMCAAFSRDGKHLAAGTGPNGSSNLAGEVKVWEVAGWKEAAGRRDYPDTVRGIGFTADNKTVVSSGQDGGVHVWPWAAGQDRQVFHKPGPTLPPQPFLAAAVSPDGRLLAVAGESKSVFVLDRAAGKVLAELTGHADVVAGLAFSPDGKTLASAAYDKAVKLWDAATWKETRTLKGHTGWVLGVAFSPDGKTLATGGYDKTVRLWDVATGEPKASWKEHTAGVRSVAFLPDGDHLVSGGSDRIVRLWDLRDGKVARQLKGHKGAVRGVAVSPDGKLIATGGEDRSVKVWDAATGAELRSVNGLPDLVTAVRFSPKGQTLAAGTFQGPVVVIDPLTGRRRQTLTGPAEGVTGLVFAPDAGQLVAVAQDRTIRQWTAVKPVAVKPGQTLGTDLGLVTAVGMLPNGQAAVLGGADGKLSLWEFAGGAKPLFHQPVGLTGGVARIAVGADNLVAAVGGNNKVSVVPIAQGRDGAWGTDGRFAAFTPDGKQVAVVNGKVVTLHDAATGQEVRKFEDGHDGPVLEAAFGPDGKLLVTAGEDTKLRLWDAATGEKKQETPPVGNYVTLSAVSFSPDGKQVAVAAYGPDVAPPDDMTGTFQPTKTVRVYPVPAADAGDWNANPTLFSPQPPDAVTTGLVWVQNGKALLVASADGTLRVNEIDGQNVKETSRFRAHGAGVLACVGTADGQVVVTAGEDAAVRRWKVGGAVQAPGTARLIPPGAGKVWESLFTPDGKYLVTAGSGDTKAFRVHTATPAAVPVEPDRHPNAYALAFSPDGKWLVTGHDDGVLVVRDAATGKEVRQLKGHAKRVWSVAFAEGGKALVSVGGEGFKADAPGEALVWDFADGTVRHTLDAPALQWTVAVHPDGTRAAVACGDGKTRVWSLADGKLVTAIPRGGNGIAYSPDGGLIALANGDGTVRVFDASTAKQLREIKIDNLRPSRVVFSPDGSEVVVTAWKGAGQPDRPPLLAAYKVADADAPPRTFPAHPQSVLGLCFLGKDTLVASGGVEGGKGSLRLYDFASGKLVGEFAGHKNWGQNVTASADGTMLASTSWGDLRTGELRLWRAAGFRPAATIPVPGTFNYLSAGAIRPDGKQLVLGGFPKYLAVWDFTDPTKPAFVKELPGHAAGLRSVSYRADGKQFVTADDAGVVKVWDADTLEPVVSFQASVVRVNRAKFTPDGTQIVTCAGRWEKAAPGEIRVWDPKTGKEVGRFPDQSREVWDVVFLDGGKKMVTAQGTTGGNEATVKLWDFAGKQVLSAIPAGAAPAPRSLAVSPDGGHLAVGSSQGPVRVFETGGWAEVAALPDLKRTAFRVEFAPDGKTVASASEELATVVLRLPEAN